MVDPDFARVLDFDEVLALWWVLEVQVLENDVGDTLEAETTVFQTGLGTNSENGSTADQIDN